MTEENVTQEEGPVKKGLESEVPRKHRYTKKRFGSEGKQRYKKKEPRSQAPGNGIPRKGGHKKKRGIPRKNGHKKKRGIPRKKRHKKKRGIPRKNAHKKKRHRNKGPRQMQDL